MTRKVAEALLLAGVALCLTLSAAPPAGAGSVTSGSKPVIERFEPTSGLPGTTVTIYGTNFDDGYSVWLGSTQLDVTSVVSNRITVKIAKNAKSGRFVLKGKHIVESGQTFTVLEPKDPPTITDIEPETGPPGETVIISGSNFSVKAYENSVMLGNVPVTVMAATPDMLKVIVPKGAVSGTFQVNVVNSGVAESEEEFTIVEPFAVESFHPTKGGPGEVVTITGSGFGTKEKDVEVTLAGIECEITHLDPHRIEVTLPKNAVGGTFEVRLRTGKKSWEEARLPGTFELVIPPVIEEIAPTGGFPGTVVTITGKHFGHDSIKLRVKLGDEIVKILSFTDTRIEAQIPKDARSAKISVEVQGRGGDITEEEFEVWVPVKLFAFSPVKGEVGTTVVIKGQGFSTDLDEMKVTLDGRPVKVVALTPEQIQVEIPEHADSGYFQVSVQDRGPPVVSSSRFKVVYPPQIASFSPHAGLPGTLLTVQGRNFGNVIDDIRVLVGPPDRQQYCIVSKLTTTKLTCQLQPSSVTGPVKVMVKGMGEDVSDESFEVWEPVTITGFSPDKGLPGTTVTISGTGFVAGKGQTRVKLGGKPVQVKSVTEDSIVVQIPDKKVAGGTFSVTVKKRGSAVSKSSFDVVLPTKILAMKPAAGPPGTVVTLRGQGFGTDINAVAVTLLGFYCTVTSISPDTIKVMVPEGMSENVSGKFQLIVTTGGIAESPKTFKVTKSKK
jgi:hypothetical protein